MVVLMVCDSQPIPTYELQIIDSYYCVLISPEVLHRLLKRNLLVEEHSS